MIGVYIKMQIYIKIVRFLHRQNKNNAGASISVSSCMLIVTILVIWRKNSKPKKYGQGPNSRRP